LSAALAAWAAAAAPAGLFPENEIGLNAIYLPGTGLGDFDAYEQGYGLELSYRNWQAEPWGWALAAGMTRFAADNGSRAWGVGLDGDLTVFPFGGSVLFKLADTYSYTVTAEGGLRYAPAQSDLTIQAGRGRMDLDVDPALLGVLRLAAEWPIAARTRFTAGLGYQADILRGEVKAGDRPVHDSILESVSVSIGLRWSL